MKPILHFSFFLSFLIFLAACSIYQSEGREAIEKNKTGIVTGSGFDSVKSVSYECRVSGSIPSFLQSQSQVISSDFEVDGFSSYLHIDQKNTEATIFVYKSVDLPDSHHYCGMNTLGDLSALKLESAVELGVQLINEQNPY